MGEDLLTRLLDRMMSIAPPPRSTHDAYLDEIRKSGAAVTDCLIAVGMLPGDEVRVGLLWTAPNRVRVLKDATLPTTDVVKLRTTIPQAMFGRWDVMSATPWRLAWSEGPSAQVWGRRGRLARVIGPKKVALRTIFRCERVVDAAEIRATVSPYWSLYTVSVLSEQGAEIVVARTRELGAIFDMGYDLVFRWAPKTGQALAEALQVPLREIGFK